MPSLLSFQGWTGYTLTQDALGFSLRSPAPLAAGQYIDLNEWNLSLNGSADAPFRAGIKIDVWLDGTPLTTWTSEG